MSDELIERVVILHAALVFTGAALWVNLKSGDPVIKTVTYIGVWAGMAVAALYLVLMVKASV